MKLGVPFMTTTLLLALRCMPLDWRAVDIFYRCPALFSWWVCVCRCSYSALRVCEMLRDFFTVFIWLEMSVMTAVMTVESIAWETTTVVFWYILNLRKEGNSIWAASTNVCILCLMLMVNDDCWNEVLPALYDSNVRLSKSRRHDTNVLANRHFIWRLYTMGSHILWYELKA